MLHSCNTGEFTEFSSDKVTCGHVCIWPRDMSGGFSNFMWRLFCERVCFFVIFDGTATPSFELFSLVDVYLCFEEIVVRVR